MEADPAPSPQRNAAGDVDPATSSNSTTQRGDCDDTIQATSNTSALGLSRSYSMPKISIATVEETVNIDTSGLPHHASATAIAAQDDVDAEGDIAATGSSYTNIQKNLLAVTTPAEETIGDSVLNQPVIRYTSFAN